MNGVLEICRASAGSGKTHKLTGEYLKMLFSGGADRYRSIMAVTFTNKATGEMKHRILEELYRIASGGNTHFMKELAAMEPFRERGSGAEDAVRRHARILLSAILNDYSFFNISTIDRFFQQILRSFAMETGHFSSYSVELNDANVLTAVVDDMMNTVDENKELLDWLIELSVEAVENGRDWNSVPQLMNLGSELFREPFKLAVRRAGGEVLGRERIAACAVAMKKIVADFRSRSREIGREALGILDRYGLAPEDFKRGSASFMFYFVKLAEGKTEPPSGTFIAMSQSGPEEWYTKSRTGSEKAAAISNAYNDGLLGLVREAAAGDRLKVYFTAVEILRNISVAGILSDIEDGVRGYCRRNNLVLLSDTPKFLSDIIDGSDTPFIYEKVGGRINNYLLDEFQDTSRMQWDNFGPLLKDGVDSGYPSLIVGDVKQSIYRWRGSDWNLLDSGVAEDFDSRRIKTGTLGYNWRSSEEIVSFNNSFFSKAGTLAGDALIDRLYSDAVQKLPEGSGRPSGHVKVTFVEDTGNDSLQEKCLERAGEDIERLLDAGYRPGDIAFLVRTKAEGAEVSEFLISKGYRIVTDDSLRISSSPSVRAVVDALRNPAGVCREKSLYNICEELIRNEAGAAEGGTAFLTAFLDCVLEYIESEGSDAAGFVRWWDTEGSGKSISAPDGDDAFRVITIHKSKGLEFKAVIIPFLNIPFSPQGNFTKYIWCGSSVPPFDMLPVYPLEFRSSLERTVFAEDYRKEKECLAVDAVNVAYVAFTRAVRELLVYARFKPDRKSGAGMAAASSVSGMLYNFLKDGLDGNVYESGAWTRPEADSGDRIAVSDINIDDFPSVPAGDRLRLSLSAGEYSEGEQMRMRGIALHGILSETVVEGDLEGAVQAAVTRGTISVNEKEGTMYVLRSMISSVRERHWFDGTYTLMTEVPILTPSGDTYRPDRVMISGSRAVVVDYKFGKKKEKEHGRQVRGYMSLLESMGYADVSGYLWYEDSVETVG